MIIKINWEKTGPHSDLFPRSWCRLGQSEFCFTAGVIKRILSITAANHPQSGHWKDDVSSNSKTLDTLE